MKFLLRDRMIDLYLPRVLSLLPLKYLSTMLYASQAKGFLYGALQNNRKNKRKNKMYQMLPGSD